MQSYDEQIIKKLEPPLKVLIEGGQAKKSLGGPVIGNGGPKEDNIITALSSKEFVINEKSATKLGRKTLSYLNKYGKLPMLAGGGFVDEDPLLSQIRPQTPQTPSLFGPRRPDDAQRELVDIIKSKIEAIQIARENIIALNKKDIEAGRTPQGVEELITLNKKYVQLQEQQKQLEEEAAARANAHEEYRLRLIEENKKLKPQRFNYYSKR